MGRLCAERGLAVLWATHLIEEAGTGADVVVLHRGQVLAQGPADTVIAQAGADSLQDAFQRLTGTAA